MGALEGSKDGGERERREQEESETLKGEPVKLINRLGEEEEKNQSEEQLFWLEILAVERG